MRLGSSLLAWDSSTLGLIGHARIAAAGKGIPLVQGDRIRLAVADLNDAKLVKSHGPAAV
jgi:hypothetical protein